MYVYIHIHTYIYLYLYIYINPLTRTPTHIHKLSLSPAQIYELGMLLAINRLVDVHTLKMTPEMIVIIDTRHDSCLDVHTPDMTLDMIATRFDCHV